MDLAKNAFSVLGHIVGNVPVAPKVPGIGKHLGNSCRSLHTCIREHNHGRHAHGCQTSGKLVLKVADCFFHHNGLPHEHQLPIIVDLKKRPRLGHTYYFDRYLYVA